MSNIFLHFTNFSRDTDKYCQHERHIHPEIYKQVDCLLHERVCLEVLDFPGGRTNELLSEVRN